MKKLVYELTKSDVETLLYTLTLIPKFDNLHDSDAQKSINIACSVRAVEKLAYQRDDFTPNEFRVMSSSLLLADMIIRGQITADAETKRECSQYIFTIQKLLPVFDTVPPKFAF